MRLSVSEAARLTGVSVRTLHYYDEIGLLHPSEVTPAGYRYYGDDALKILQQILFFRELGFPLKEIAAMLQRPDYDRRLALARHRELLLLKRRHLDTMLALVDETLKEDTTMNHSDSAARVTSADVDAARARYAAEAAEKWGGTGEYAESERRWAAYTPADKDGMNADMADIFSAFAALCRQNANPAGDEARALVRRWQAHITRWHYPCTDEILAGLGLMYTADERFARTLNAYGAGTARFMGEAIAAVCGS